MKLTVVVSIYGLNKTGKDEKIGDIIYDGEKITTSSNSRLLKYIATEPITLRDMKQVKPDEEPEKFMRSLYLAYHGSYVRAMRAVET